VLRRWIEKRKAAKALERERAERGERLFNEARDSRVSVKVVVNVSNGGSYTIQKEVSGWAYRDALGDEYRHARKRAEKWFVSFCDELASTGFQTPDGRTHFPPAQIVKIKRSDFIDL